MTTIDLKDGFFHVPVLPSHQAFMSFQWEGKTYVFQVLPFGMSASPWLFTCFVQAMVHHLHHQGMQVMAYMDNFIIIGHSHRQAQEHTTRTLGILDQLGWQVNFCCLKRLNRQLMLCHSAWDLHGGTLNEGGPVRVPVQKLAAVIGQGVALTKAILPAKLLLHNAYCNIAWRANWNSLVPLSAATILDLKDWCHGLSTWNAICGCATFYSTQMPPSLVGGHLWGQH